MSDRVSALTAALKRVGSTETNEASQASGSVHEQRGVVGLNSQPAGKPPSGIKRERSYSGEVSLGSSAPKPILKYASRSASLPTSNPNSRSKSGLSSLSERQEPLFVGQENYSVRQLHFKLGGFRSEIKEGLVSHKDYVKRRDSLLDDVTTSRNSGLMTEKDYSKICRDIWSIPEPQTSYHSDSESERSASAMSP